MFNKEEVFKTIDHNVRSAHPHDIDSPIASYAATISRTVIFPGKTEEDPRTCIVRSIDIELPATYDHLENKEQVIDDVLKTQSKSAVATFLDAEEGDEAFEEWYATLHPAPHAEAVDPDKTTETAAATEPPPAP